MKKLITSIYYRYLKPAKKRSGTGAIKILCYHGIVEQITEEKLERNFHTIDQFREHIKLLKRKKYHFLNATELVQYLHQPDQLKEGKYVVITFDDGYKNNLTAIEILKKEMIPGIFFVTSGAINSSQSIWTVNLSLLLLKGNISTLHYKEKAYTMNNEANRLVAFQEIRTDLKRMEAASRKMGYQTLVEQFPAGEIESLLHTYPTFRMLTWEEMKHVQGDAIQFQSHGHRHEIFHEAQSVEAMKDEITTSKELIEKHLQNKVFLYAYPNGNSNGMAEELLVQKNYRAAFKLDTSSANNSTLYNIPRITPNRKHEKFAIQMTH